MAGLGAVPRAPFVDIQSNPFSLVVVVQDLFAFADRSLHLQTLAQHREPLPFAEASRGGFIVPRRPDRVVMNRVGLHLVMGALEHRARPILVEAAGTAG